MSNVVSFTGRLGSDAEVRHLPSGQSILTCNVANNIGIGDKQKTNWFRVSVWGKRAEGKLVDFLRKGQDVFVAGELSTSEFQAKDGSTKFSLEVNANIIDLIGKKSDSAPAPQAQPTPAAGNTAANFDDDIPF